MGIAQTQSGAAAFGGEKGFENFCDAMDTAIKTKYYIAFVEAEDTLSKSMEIIENPSKKYIAKMKPHT